LSGLFRRIEQTIGWKVYAEVTFPGLIAEPEESID
jgi:hypothetical protein